MDFVVVIPEKPEVGRLPWLDRTVAEAGWDAALGLGAKRTLRPAEAGALEGRGLILPEGLVGIPEGAVRELVEGDRGTMSLGNARKQTIAIAVSGEAVEALPLDSFDQAAAAGSEPSGEPVCGATRIVDAATWSEALRESRRRVAERFLAVGALIEDPATLWADPTVEVAAGARIGPSVQLTGTTRIGAGAEVAGFTRLHNTVVAEGARIESHSVVLDADIGREAKAGPFARIRPGTVLDPGAYVGGFVETKNARIGRNAAIPHLSYVGDADIGVGVEVGAGTISCKYGGRGTHRTRVDTGVFVGSNAILVAPVTIGRRACVAAGSVIVEDVPAEAMAIGRGRQVNKPDRAGNRFEGADEV